VVALKANTSQAGWFRPLTGIYLGTTADRRDNGDGTVFRVSLRLGPFVETEPTAAKVGATVKILGTNRMGAISVNFNGTAATFNVMSSSEITATVTTSATTGDVQVVTPSGTLLSNVSLRVP
jgi:hypothetical protein